MRAVRAIRPKSGSDVVGAKRHDFDVDFELDNQALDTGDTDLGSDTDHSGTGERAAADSDPGLVHDADIEPDRIVDSSATDDDDLDEDPTGRQDCARQASGASLSARFCLGISFAG